MFNLATTKEFGPYTVQIGWEYDESSLHDAFGEGECNVDDMIEACANGVDTHYVLVVKANVEGIELGTSYLGSCYASDCTPEKDIEDNVGGYLTQQIEEALKEARNTLRTLSDLYATTVQV